MLETQFLRQKYRDGTFTDSNDLANVLGKQPETLDFIVHAFGNSYANKATGGTGYGLMQYLTQGAGAVGRAGRDYQEVGNEQIKWFLQGNYGKPVAIAGTAFPQVDSFLGRGFTEFTVPLEDSYYSLGDVVRFPGDIKARIQAAPVKSGDVYNYTMKIIGSDPSIGIAAADITPGTLLGLAFNAFEEGSHGGSMKESTPMGLTNQMTTMRASMGMTGSAKTDEVVVLKIKGKMDGKDVNKSLWMPEKYHQMLVQWTKTVEGLIWDGVYNRLPDGSVPIEGSNGRPVIIGDGLKAQISASNEIVTSKLSTDMLQHMLIDVADQSAAENQKRVLITGHGGAKAFHDALTAASQNLTIVDSNFISKLTGNKLSFGSQFTTYRGFYGTEVTVMIHPMFNDKTCFPEVVGPYGYTRESYNMYFLDMSDYGGRPNINMLFKGAGGESRRFKQWYTGGSTTPQGESESGMPGSQITNKLRSHDGDYFSLHFLSEMMVQVRNPLTCGTIKLVPSE